MDETKVWELAQSVERTATNQKHILKLLEQLEGRMRAVEKQDDRQEERIAQMQEAMANLVESVQRVEVASTRLRQTALVLLGVLAVLTGVLGWDILPKALKAGLLTLM